MCNHKNKVCFAHEVPGRWPTHYYLCRDCRRIVISNADTGQTMIWRNVCADDALGKIVFDRMGVNKNVRP